MTMTVKLIIAGVILLVGGGAILYVQKLPSDDDDLD